MYCTIVRSNNGSYSSLWHYMYKEEYKEELNEWFVVELDDGVLCVSRGEEDNDEYYKVK